MNKFLTSVADAYFYDGNGVLLFFGKTLLDDSVTTTVSKTEIRGGKGNQLLTTYYHTSGMAIKITDTQWNLNMLAATTGSSVQTKTDIYTEEKVTLTSGAGQVGGTPKTVQGGLYGWIQFPDVNPNTGVAVTETNQRVAFTATNHLQATGTNSAYDGDVCVRYYAENAAATYVQIPANIVPKTGRLVLDAQLVTGSASSTSVIGKAEFIVPSAQLSGAFAISMTSAGVSTTPIEAMALADTSLNTGDCADVPLYCKVTEILTSVYWYSNVYALAISGGDFTIVPSAVTGHTVEVFALAPNSLPFQPPVADLSFASGTTGVATIGPHTGILTSGGSTGTSRLSVYITSSTGIEDSALMTVTN